jgi:hypothetical protein
MKFRCRYALHKIPEKLDFNLDKCSIQNTSMCVFFYCKIIQQRIKVLKGIV